MKASQLLVLLLAVACSLVLAIGIGAVVFDRDAAASCDTGSPAQPPRAKASNSIPRNYIRLYEQAARRYAVPWNVLAGVGKIESDHGRSTLPGVHQGENHAGAGGPMQFLRETWNTYGVDGNNDRKKDRYNPEDAIPGAANYLRASGAPSKLRQALYAYNQSWAYVKDVLSWAKRYAAGDFSADSNNNTGLDCLPGSGPGRPDGLSGARSPITGRSPMTKTMREALLEIDGKFGPFPTIGCFRNSGDPQDHGLGRACDFMETRIGRMPSASAQRHGQQVANYAVQHGRRLGVSYVIWRQRIWNVGRGDTAWRTMSDRGSITANHYDHVHLSVLR
ncbi:hypothetical protein GCM10010411_75750 [Actinomadura fulvescens]|uniref:Transglycosylase SLT domain-containing protein n=1 Tax=Actinomadura fulvescens TaxID=46160 RepID=A0ABN3QIL5_9ACTN